jgi:ribA/ribD-fused uncharacterized protein
VTCPIIYEFREDNFFLSNFAAVNIKVPIPQPDGPPLLELYSSVEHAFQALKTEDPEERKKFQPGGLLVDEEYRTMTAAEAKKFGRMVSLSKNWSSIRVSIMAQLVALKFGDPIYKGKLLATRPKMLIEGNYWHDNFWGACFCSRATCRGASGLNRLGQILMNVREGH